MLRFGPFTFHDDPPDLRRDGETVRLRPQAMELLSILLEEPGRLVTRETIHERIPGDAVVEYGRWIDALVEEVRDALGDDDAPARFVETVPRRGYRFVAPVEGVGALREDSPAARRWWLSGIGLLLLAMILVPGAIHRLTAPRPVGVTVAPPAVEPPEALVTLLNGLGPALDASPALTFVPWSFGPPEGADLVLELGPTSRDPSGVSVTVRLYRRPGREPVWEERIPAREADGLAVRVVAAVEEAVRRR